MTWWETLLGVAACVLGFTVLPVLVTAGEEAWRARSLGRRVSLRSVLAPVLRTGRLVSRQEVTPGAADAPVLAVVPWTGWVAGLAVFAMVPWRPGAALVPAPASLAGALAALVLISAVPVLVGLAAGDGTARLAALRSAEQGLAVIPPLVLAAAGPAVAAGSLSLDGIAASARWWWPASQLAGLAVFLLAGAALLRRPPLDAAGQGWDAVLTGPRLLAARLGRAAALLVLALLAATLFLGGWAGPAAGVLGPVWLLLKTLLVLAGLVWADLAVPRARPGRVIRAAWTVLLPVAAGQLLLTATVVALA